MFSVAEGSCLAVLFQTDMSRPELNRLYSEHCVLLLSGPDDVSVIADDILCLLPAEGRDDCYVLVVRISTDSWVQDGAAKLGIVLSMGRDGWTASLDGSFVLLPTEGVSLMRPRNLYLTEGFKSVQSNIYSGFDADMKDRIHVFFECADTFDSWLQTEFLLEVEFRVLDAGGCVVMSAANTWPDTLPNRRLRYDMALKAGTWADGDYRVQVLFMGRPLMSAGFEIGRCVFGQRQPEDLCESVTTPVVSSDELTVGQALAPIQAMVGLDGVKRRLASDLHYARFLQKRGKAMLPVHARISHMVMTGSPGTGKTTVARHWGAALKAMGLLAKGHLVECNRASLTDEHIGGSEQRTAELIKAAQGGVLFIDEAYSLFSSDDSRDFGRQVINTLMTELSRKDSDMVVIMAGYPEEMERLLKSNPGLKSRFPVRLDFPDYTSDELVEIAVRWFDTYRYRLCGQTHRKLRTVVSGVMGLRPENFGGGRFIDNLIMNLILPRMAERVADRLGGADECLLTDILPEDIPEAAEVVPALGLKARVQRRVGFMS